MAKQLPICDYIRSIPDNEFWGRVMESLRSWDIEEQPIDWIDPYDTPTPCPECGSTSACGFDAEGRPMIHALKVDYDG